MSRHNWIQWNSKAQQGERDFTLKRKGTKDYTRSIKKSKKLAISELSSSPLPGVYNGNPKRPSNESHIYNELAEASTFPRRSNGNIVTHTNTIDLNQYNTIVIPENGISASRPLSNGNGYSVSVTDEYGSFRKGPYIIHENVDHVCFRKMQENEDATEL